MIKRIIATVLVMLFALSTVVSSKEIVPSTYSGYEFNDSGESVAAPIGYSLSDIIDANYIGLEKGLSGAKDMIYSNGFLYVLDSDNSRIVVLDKNYKLSSIREKFTDKSGATIEFAGAQGMDVTDEGTLYIADSENNRILIFDSSNVLIREITRPDSALLDTGFPFRVTKVHIDRQGCILAIAESVNAGAFRFAKNGEFLGFFGRNVVVRTADVLLNYIYKKILTREQISKLKNYTPRIIVNLDIDETGFVYFVDSSNSTVGASAVRKLNYKGENIFESNGIIDTFGDMEWDREEVKKSYTSFGDVDISDKGFINLLDVGRNKVFQYTQDGQLISVFGGRGNQQGMFTDASAIESVGDSILVLDSTENIISVFNPTEYGAALQNAFLLLDSEEVEKSKEAWEKVLKLNSNSLYPYYGLGLAYENADDYKSAMEMFKISNSKEEYSTVFREYRQIFLQKNSWWMSLLAILFLVAVILVVRCLKMRYAVKSGHDFSVLENKYAFPIYTLFHPVDGFDQFKWRKNLTSWRMTLGIIFAWFLISFLTYFETGFIFNYNKPEEYNIFVSLISTILLYVLFVACNWGVSSLFDGSGKAKEIACVTAYALIPYILSQLVNFALTHFIVLEESFFLTIVTVIGFIWSFILILCGLYSIHQYSVSKTIANIVLTFLAMAIAALIIILFFTLMQQILFFIRTIAEEWRLR